MSLTMKLDDCTLQLSHNGTYLDLESTLAEQRDELEGFQEDAGATPGQAVFDAAIVAVVNCSIQLTLSGMEKVLSEMDL
ncbi:FH1/FH2 domain-containing protein 3-like isoform X8 [Willisornis vidua]|uniref:FH1/FH2 domain-containing protein 3-like isoform X8 n=1 Tax=Willisornis vidua TaxID=1566151 RepID=A0ABQ9DDZ7_9PASS|nr:FH1/FH2 domain-containing protein 3-like isoform X8 [Willisornis vidua]